MMESPLHFQEQDHAGWLAPGEVVPTTDFQYPDDEPNGAALDDAIPNLAAALKEILGWIWTSQRPNAALVRLVSMTATLRPELMNNQTFEQLGAQLGVTKQSISYASTAFERRFKLQFRRGRTATARRSMSAAMRLSWQARHAAKQGTGTLSEP